MKITDVHIDGPNFFLDSVEKSAIVLGNIVLPQNTEARDFQMMLPLILDSQYAAPEYVIDVYGFVYRLYPDGSWSRYSGINDSLNMRVISIGLINQGCLTQKGNMKLSTSGIYKGDVVDATVVWRGYNRFAPYRTEQIESLINLLDMLGPRYDIPLLFVPDPLEYDPRHVDAKGILYRASVSPTATDLTPAFPLVHVAKALKPNY